MRYNQLMNEIEGISPRIFTIQLKELEKDGIINREIVSVNPKKVVYSLSDKGRSLLPILVELAQWGLDNLFSHMVTLDKEMLVPKEEEVVS